MLSTDKLANYNNILASVEKLTGQRTKAAIIKALRDLSDEQLQTVDSCSDILNKILRGIECFNNNKKKIGGVYGQCAIKIIINLSSESGYDRLINTNLNVLELLISYQDGSIFYSFDYNNCGGNWNNFSHLNDDKFHCLIASEDFCKVLLKTDYMGVFLSVSHRDDIISNEGFESCINNQDLILVYCFTNQEVGTNIEFIKYPGESTFHDKNLQYKIEDISLLQTHCAAKLMKDRGISAELCQTQVT